jgi:hypothetical protein
MSLQYSTALRSAQVTQLQNLLNGSSVTPWAASTAYAVGAYVQANGNVYRATVAGSSATTGSGPSGTGASITDGTVTWAYQAPTLKVFSGGEPTNVAAADPTGLLATITLPNPCLTTSAGATNIAGTWSAAASAGGTGASFRMYDGAGNPHIQGNTTSDLILNNNNIALNQTVTVTQFTVAAANA